MSEKEYIEREAAKEVLCSFCTCKEICEGRDGCNAINAFDAILAADVEPVRHGRWIKLGVHHGMEQYKCSECNVACYVPEIMGEPMYEGCPICRAKMDGGVNDEAD